MDSKCALESKGKQPFQIVARKKGTKKRAFKKAVTQKAFCKKNFL